MPQFENFDQDLQDINQIPILHDLLKTICQITGMGFAAVARVTENRWIACSLVDTISFGMKPGDELEIKTTICNEIRAHQQPVIIDNVSLDPDFKDHHTPKLYGLQGYISIPIIRKNGQFFGTLCAIDPQPHELKKPEILAMFRMFADLISFHLNAVEEMRLSQNQTEQLRQDGHIYRATQKIFTDKLEAEVLARTLELQQNNERLVSMNAELQSFAYVSSHDLQEPLRKIQTYISILDSADPESLAAKTSKYFGKIKEAATRMQTLINDLFDYSQTDNTSRNYELVSVKEIIDEVKAELQDEMLSNVAIEFNENLCPLHAIKFQFKQLFSNLISNSMKFSKSDEELKIKIDCQEMKEENSEFCQIIYEDNGIGFDEKYSKKAFQIFQRLHDPVKYPGTGIGLAIVQKIVENHHGTIQVHSKVDQGTRFEMRIPLDLKSR